MGTIFRFGFRSDLRGREQPPEDAPQKLQRGGTTPWLCLFSPCCRSCREFTWPGSGGGREGIERRPCGRIAAKWTPVGRRPAAFRRRPSTIVLWPWTSGAERGGVSLDPVFPLAPVRRAARGVSLALGSPQGRAPIQPLSFLLNFSHTCSRGRSSPAPAARRPWPAFTPLNDLLTDAGPLRFEECRNRRTAGPITPLDGYGSRAPQPDPRPP